MSSTTPDIASIKTDNAENWVSVAGLVDTDSRGSADARKVRSSFSAGYA